jgi:protein TonB
MFHQLLESNAARKPHLGGSFASTVGHAALVVAALALTTQREHVRAAPDPTITFTQVIPTPAEPSPAGHGTQGGAVAAVARALPPSIAVVPIILDIAVGIVSPDLSRPVSDAIDFSRRGGPAGSGTGGIGSGGPGESGTWLADQVDKPVIMITGSATPTYPAMLRSAGINGGVLAEFVVDTLGRVEPGSSKIVQSDHDLFAAAVRDVMSRLRFMPAEARGHKVRQLVRLPFRFDLNEEHQS